jgi:hypothetical protein
MIERRLEDRVAAVDCSGREIGFAQGSAPGLEIARGQRGDRLGSQRHRQVDANTAHIASVAAAKF